MAKFDRNKQPKTDDSLTYEEAMKLIEPLLERYHWLNDHYLVVDNYYKEIDGVLRRIRKISKRIRK